MSDLSIGNNAAPATVIQHFYEAAIVLGEGPLFRRDADGMFHSELRSIGVYPNI